MPTPNNYLMRVVARTGLAAKVRAFLTGEMAYARDTKTFYVGDDTSTPPKIMTTKSTDTFDFSGAKSVKLPGGSLFDSEKPGLVDGVNIKQFNGANGIVVRTADGKFANRALTSTDGSLIVEQPRGVEGDINLKLDPNSAVLKAISVSVIQSELPPENPVPGMLWFDTEESVMYIRLEDATNAIWVSLT